MNYKLLLLFLTTTVIVVYSTPLPSGYKHLKLKDFDKYENQLAVRLAVNLEDENVRELKNLKTSDELSVSSIKSQKLAMTNTNGKKEKQVEFNEEVNKNGELLGKIHRKIFTKQNPNSSPKTHFFTEVEIPRQGVHKVYEQDIPEVNIPKRSHTKRKSVFRDNRQVDVEEPSDWRNEFLPQDFAEYIYETGDEKTVTQAVEGYLQAGVIDKKEAIAYLQEIQAALNALVEQEQRQRRQELETMNEYPKEKTDMNMALSDLREIRAMIQNQYLRNSMFPEENDDSDPKYRRSFESNNADADNDLKYQLLERYYKNMMNKLQGDYQPWLTEASMDNVIYQLAKVLFMQAFSMGEYEAQESLKQFTTFLEQQVDEGRITPNMEKKVLGLLLSALSDILHENPELLNSINDHKFKKINGKNVRAFKHNSVEKKSSRVSSKQAQNNKKFTLKSSGIMDDEGTH